MPKQKISRVLFPPPLAGDDDHQSGMPIARHLKRPTRKLSFAFGSGQVPHHRRGNEAGSLSLSRQGRDRDESFLIRSCSQVGFAQTDVTTGPGGLLHHLFTLTPRSRQRQDSGRSFFCGTFRPFRVNPSLGLSPSGRSQDKPLRALVLRGTLPWRARTFLPDLCWDRG
jgi:hypothetical protein